MKDKKYLTCKYLDAGMDGMLCLKLGGMPCKLLRDKKCVDYTPKGKKKVMKDKETKFKDTKSLDNAYMSLAKHYEERKENAIRQIKDGAFVNLLNQEIEELQKAKQIEEMAKKKQYKPQLRKKVYCIYDDECILVEEVGYLGKKSFIIADFNDCNNFDSFEWYYEDYNETWFTNLEKAKKKLLEVAYREDNEKLKVVKLYDNYYGLRE